MNTLLLEDDVDLGGAVVEHLECAGHTTHWCKLLSQARAAPWPELALLDLTVPDGDGIDLLHEWRAAGRQWPVIVLTARDQVSDRIRGLRAGADDYLVKPFDLDELLARVAAVCRRVLPARQIVTSNLVIDLESRLLLRNGEHVALTAMEWAVFTLLASAPGRLVERSRIEKILADSGMTSAESNSLEVIISRLRRKAGAKTITTSRGLGYSFDVNA
jgi:two-component system, OmpR family, response regulator